MYVLKKKQEITVGPYTDILPEVSRLHRLLSSVVGVLVFDKRRSGSQRL